MRKKILSHMVAGLVVISIFTPVYVFSAENAPSLIVCNGVDDPATVGVNEACDFNSVIKLAQAIMDFLLYISIYIAAGLFIWAGILYTTARDDSGQVSKAKEIFKDAAIGFIIMLSAWVIVYTIVYGLTGESDYLKFFKK